MDELIRDMMERGLICIVNKGSEVDTLTLLHLLVKTEPIETDKNWWELRLLLRSN